MADPVAPGSLGGPPASRRQTAGQVLSELARKGLMEPAGSTRVRNGVPVLPRRPPASPRPTMKLVNEMRDAE